VIYAQKAEYIEIATSPETEYQLTDGFGGSDAWMAQFVGKY
tara:strand:+ start:232 stop:354 length:123 start_codon:yes stop_codon:yes gene_type:complete